MKKILKITGVILLIITASACRKVEKLNVDYSGFNPDNPNANSPLDKWIATNFLNPFNIDVIYRYNRYYHGNTANVVPSKLENIQPTMQIVLDGFINPYVKVAGEAFAKKYIPKEWVLFGSYSYANTSDPGVAGTAAGGRRITLYGVNEYQPLPAGQFYAWDRQRIMHHEQTHILNQIIPIPPEFETISRGLYKQPYDLTPTDTARKYGFVTSYASGVHTEDYAETVSWSLINGQVWYDDWANGASAEGKSRLIQKQNNVINYFTNLGINFKALQKEVQLYMKSINRDQTKFAYWLNKRRYPASTTNLIPTFASMTVSTTSDTYIKYGGSAEFALLYNGVKSAIAAQGYNLNFLKLNFTSPTTMYVEANFTGGTTTYQSFYALNTAINVNAGEVTFTTGTAAGTTAPWVGNAAFTKASIQPFLDYLTNNTLVADWLPVNASVEDYMKIGGFSIKGSPTNYFYGPLAY
ncbi:substrate import-associated zinc metallohydrolase lipoprotein [Pedobacter sp. Du54]|uniref:substrate import-associated zinc metallohydrolase lipoprotein n=1 Tax=Pedobacter anseongensis TaxID=3133439 RepID=UPI00309788DD